MLYCLIIVIGALLVTLIVSIKQDEMWYNGISIVCCAIFLCIWALITLCICESDFEYVPIKYENNEIVEVEESNYILKYRERLNEFTFVGKVEEFELIYKGETVINCTEDFYKITEYFQPEGKFKRMIGE